MDKIQHYYHEDLAYVHDVGYGAMAKAAGEFLLGQLKIEGIQEGNIIDLGCGSGILAAILTAEGYKVTGIDYSEDLLQIARRRAPQATFIKGSYLDYDFPSCIAVTSIGEPLCYIFDPANNGAALKGLFHKIFNALKPGGFFVFDIVEPGILGEEPVLKRIVEEKEWTMFLDNTEDREKHLLKRDIHLFRRIGDLYRKSRETHQLQLYHRTEISKMLQETGFTVKVVDHYSNYQLREHNPAFVARKSL